MEKGMGKGEEEVNGDGQEPHCSSQPFWERREGAVGRRLTVHRVWEHGTRRDQPLEHKARNL